MPQKVSYILLADDDPEDREMFVDRFHLYRPTVPVECLDSGYAVLDWLEKCSPDQLPDLILVDYKMHGMTGTEVLRTIQHDERFLHVPKIVWSTSNNSKYIDECLQNGARKYFTKPSDMQEFDKMINYLGHLVDTGN